MTRCKTCNGEGALLKETLHMEHIGVDVHMTALQFEPVTCMCCGGWPDHCVNCEAGERIIDWQETDNFDESIEEWMSTHVDFFLNPHKTWFVDYEVTEEQHEEMLKQFNRLLQKIGVPRLRIEELIPGNHKKDVVVLARQSRLAMVQLMFDRGHFTKEQALEQLDAELSEGDPSTYYDDSALLQPKENTNGSKKEEID